MAMAGQRLLLEVSKLTELRSVRVLIKESFKGAAITGGSALICSLIFGPVGFAIGGAIGGCSATLMSNKFKLIPDIIRDNLTAAQQDELVAAILETIRSIPVRDAVDFAVNVAQNPAVASTVALTVISYVNNMSGMQIVD